MVSILPLTACGSYVPPLPMSRSETAGLKAEPRPELSKASARNADSYRHVPASAPLTPARVERASLAPLAPASPGAAATPVSYAFASTISYEAAPARAAGDRLVREANNHAWQKRPPYMRDDAYPAAPQRGEPRGDYMPPQQPAYAEPDAASGGEYVVQPGDTLYDIGRQHGLSAEELIEINRLGGSHIQPGQRLRVDARGASQGSAPYREAAPDPRAYREPAEPRGAPYREREAEPYARPQAPDAKAYSYEPEPQPAPRSPRQPRYEAPDPREARRPPTAEEGDYAAPARGSRDQYAAPARGGSREPARAYAPDDRDGPDYTSSNRGYTPDGPFEPNPDAPWRGEAEWRRLAPRSSGQPEAYQPPRAPRQEERQPPRYGRPGAYDSHDNRGDYAPQPQPRSVTRAPYEEQPGGYASAPRATPQTARGADPVHRVQRGETLAEIARRNGLDQAELAAYNGLPPNVRLRAGQDLQIPQGQGYNWGAPPAEIGPRPGPRPRGPVSSTTAEPRPQAKAAAAAPAPAPRNLPQAHAKVTAPPTAAQPRPGEAAPQRRHPARPPAEEIAEVTLPTAPADEPAEAPASRVALATGEPPAAAPLAEPAALTPAENVPPRECETLLANPEPRSAKSFRLPVQGMVISKFGAKDDGSFNDGINFSVPKGTPVKAAENGVVAYAGDELPGFGNLVLIRHADGYVTAYAHNDELLVKKCDVVKRGQIISKAGATGTVKPQLHFELRKDSKPIDPESHFAGA